MLRYHKHNHILLFLIPTLLFILVLYLILPFGSEYSMDDLIEQPSISGTFRAFMAEEFAAQAIAYNNPKTDDWVLPITGVKRGGAVVDGAVVDIDTYAGHNGVDFRCPKAREIKTCPYGGSKCEDTCVIAPVSGTITCVERTKNQKSNFAPGKNSGHLCGVVIKADSGSNIGLYFDVEHMSDIPKNLTVGSHVDQGQFLGYTCAQGYSTGAHCHFSVHNNGNRFQNHESRLSELEYYNNFVLHNSVSSLSIYKGYAKTRFKQDVIDNINNKPRYDSEVVEV